MSYLIARCPLGQDSTSWIGGVPRIEASQWPRCSVTGLPLHFIAQIDLSAVPEGATKAGLPAEGWLSFFADTEFSRSSVQNGFPASIIYSEQLAEPCTPPSDLPPPYGQDFEYVLEYHVFHPRDRFLSSPVELVEVAETPAAKMAKAASVKYDSTYDPARDGLPFREAAAAWRVLLQRAIEKKRIKFDVEKKQQQVDWLSNALDAIREFEHLEDDAFKAAIDAAGYASYSYSPVRAREDCEERLEHARNMLSSEKINEETLPKLMAELLRISEEGEALSPMSQQDYEILLEMTKALTAISSKVYQALPRHMRGVLGIQAFGARPQLDLLPPTVAQHWNSNPYSAAGPHVFLGTGQRVQKIGKDFKGCQPLLHLSCDTVLELGWGDMGIVQFWMHPDDIRERNWDKVKLRMAGH
jgi:hypothetical protein